MTDYAYYRLPYSDNYTRIESNSSLEIIDDIQKIGTCSGFVISPFSEGDTILIKPDRITRQKIPLDINHERYCSDVTSTIDLEYKSVFSKYYNAVSSGEYGKLVLARKKTIKVDKDIDPFLLFIKACQQFPRLMIMLFNTDVTGTWIVASPELLLESSNDHHHTIALAGTMPYKEGYSNWSDKNKCEQHIVEKYIENTLSSICSDILMDGPISMRAGHLQHLRTDFRFRGSSIGKILYALHPTPAVAGYPVSKAVSFIRNNENISRKYYSGFAGPVDIDNHTDIYVSLRCAEIFTQEVILYAGGGIMPDSECEFEWIETEQKMSTISCIVTNQI